MPAAPTENAEVVRRVLEAFARRDFDAALEPLHPDIEWDAATHGVWPDSQIVRGVPAVRDFFRSWLGAFDDYEVSFDGYEEAGDLVLVHAWERGRGKASGVVVEQEFTQVWTVEDGRVTRFVAYRDRDEARTALGYPAEP